jgi:hypothetical protein
MHQKHAGQQEHASCKVLVVTKIDWKLGSHKLPVANQQSNPNDQQVEPKQGVGHEIAPSLACGSFRLAVHATAIEESASHLFRRCRNDLKRPLAAPSLSHQRGACARPPLAADPEDTSRNAASWQARWR